MQPRIEILNEKKFVGLHKRMSFARNTTFALWQAFMPRRKEIHDVRGIELYSIEVYDTPLFFSNFSPTAEFNKWAAVEVNRFDTIPAEMETLKLPSGLYAIFTYKGTAQEGQKTYEYIFNNWLPDSGFVLDDRPHLAIMGEKYKNNHPDSEEEIAIPVR